MDLKKKQRKFISEYPSTNNLTMFTRDYDIDVLSGIGSGCSYSTAKSWFEPVWKYKNKEISRLKKQLEEMEEAAEAWMNKCDKLREKYEPEMMIPS